MHSRVKIQNNAGLSFLTADAAASFACKCMQIKTAEVAELLAEQRQGCISQFSVNADGEVVEFHLNVYNIIDCDKTLLITLNGKQKHLHSMLAKFGCI